MTNGEAASATARPSRCEAPAGGQGEARAAVRQERVPEFSPAMLRLFLRARIAHAVHVAGAATPGQRHDAARKAKAAIRRAAKVTNFEFEFAWMGRLANAATRAKLWGALGVVPAEHGVTLTDDGGQRNGD